MKTQSDRSMLRRSVAFVVTLAVGMAALLAAPAFAQPPSGPPKLTSHLLRGGVYWVTGGVSNSAFVVGDKGVVVFDTEISVPFAQALIAEIVKATPKPVNQIVLSHADPDHVGGLPAFPAGTPIVAQENATPIIEASIADPNAGPRLGPLYRALDTHLPTQTVGDDSKVTVDGVRMELIHVAPAHTPADLVVFMPQKRIVLAGDLLVNSFEYPVIHDGGSSLGWIEFMHAILALDADTYVPGHGDMLAKPVLQARLQHAMERRDAVKALVDRHATLAQVEQALPEKALDPRFGTFTDVVYRELTKGYPDASRPPWTGVKVN